MTAYYVEHGLAHFWSPIYNYDDALKLLDYCKKLMTNRKGIEIHVFFGKQSSYPVRNLYQGAHIYELEDIIFQEMPDEIYFETKVQYALRNIHPNHRKLYCLQANVSCLVD